MAWVVSSIYGFSFLPAWCIQKAQTMRLVVVVVAAGAKEPIADGRGCGRGCFSGSGTGKLWGGRKIGKPATHNAKTK